MHGTHIQYVFSNVSFDAAEVGEMNLQPGNSLCGQTWPCLIHQAPKGGFNKEMKKQRLDYVRLNVICLSSQRFH